MEWRGAKVGLKAPSFHVVAPLMPSPITYRYQ
jgi:hypothetical protein